MQIESIIATYDPISLEEMDSVKLMNRTDTKYMMSYEELEQIISQLSDDYRVLEVNDTRFSSYRSLYFDTPNHDFYYDHHRGKVDRYKVRIRKYVESNLYFLEIKHKIKGRTDKKRIQLNGFEENLSESSMDFVASVFNFRPQLAPSLWNSFERITLVNRKLAERMTIDLNLSFEWDGWKRVEKNLVIVEVKQENVNRSSPFMITAKHALVRPMRMSKYCIGMIHKDDSLKYNNFKPKLLKIQKLDNGLVA